MTGVGSRGGNVRSVEEARALQGDQKDKRFWAAAIDEQITRTLVATGYFHADDLEALEIPPEHSNLPGTRTASFANRKLMEKTGVERKVNHKAANGRKAAIYRITAKGRKELPKLVGNGAGEPVGQAAPSSGGEVTASAPSSGLFTTSTVSDETPVADGALTGGSSHASAPDSSDQPLVGVTAGLPTPERGGRLEDGDEAAGSHSGKSSAAASRQPRGSGGVSDSTSPCAAAEPARLFDDAPPSAYDPWKDAA